jgi:tripartite-type tricarboxylate transporter receptor subunit TctC
MEVLMRAIVAAIVAGVVSLSAPVQAQDQAKDWPAKQITIVVPFGAGGSADLLARILATHMQTKFGQTVVVENRPGAGGSIGTNYVAKAAPDGYTLLLGTVSSIAVNAALYAKLPFDVDKDIQPITQLVSFPNLLIVNPKLPIRNVQELIDYVKKNDGKVNYASSGIGTSSHLSVVMFEQAIGAKMTHVPYKSTGDVVNCMLGGNVDIAIDSMTTVWPHAKQGTVRALGVSTPQRSASAPEVPAIGETIKGFEATAWQGLFAPAGVPKPIVEKIATEARRIWGLPEVKTQLANAGADSVLSESPDAFTAFTRAQRAKWAEVVKAAGVKIE